MPSGSLVAKKDSTCIKSRAAFRLTIENANDDQSVRKSELESVAIGRAYYAASVGLKPKAHSVSTMPETPYGMMGAMGEVNEKIQVFEIRDG